jgi:parallel beta-helix repeat protein
MKKKCLAVFLSGFFVWLGMAGNALSGNITVCPTVGMCEYTTIQSAINAAEEHPQQGWPRVKVKSGTYYENINFIGKPIEVFSFINSGPVIIDGSNDSSKSVVTFDSSEGADSILDGFIIRDGAGTSINGTIYGGGILIDGSSPSITNCTVTNNTASSGDGGGMYIFNSSSPIINDCLIFSNTAERGAGIYTDNSAPNITLSTVSYNTALNGGGGIMFNYSTPTVTDCEIIGNTGGWGAGIDSHTASVLSISDCLITENSGTTGAGFALWGKTSGSITNCVIHNNTAESYGGGFFSNRATMMNLVNCMITSNRITPGGGQYAAGAGIYNDTHTHLTVTNSTIADNHNDSTARGGGIETWYYSTLTVRNSILSGNTNTSGYNQIYRTGDYYVGVTYSDVVRNPAWGPYPGTGNINADPLFESGGDYNLSSNSPCIDEGTSTGAPAYDIDGDSRPFDMPKADSPTAYDMGADEYVTP